MEVRFEITSGKNKNIYKKIKENNKIISEFNEKLWCFMINWIIENIDWIIVLNLKDKQNVI